MRSLVLTLLLATVAACRVSAGSLAGSGEQPVVRGRLQVRFSPSRPRGG
jgi:hypothetical protein